MSADGAPPLVDVGETRVTYLHESLADDDADRGALAVAGVENRYPGTRWAVSENQLVLGVRGGL